MAPDAKNNGQQWIDAERQIIEALDIRSLYQSMGVEFTSDEPTSKGWLACRAVDREDRHPSAAVNIIQGRYKDLGGAGASLSIWDFAAQYGGYRDWQTARRELAKQVGVDLPRTKDSRAVAKLSQSPATPGQLLIWSRAKPPISTMSMLQAGVRQGRWPKGLPPELQNHVLAFPCYGKNSLDDDPHSFHLVHSSGTKQLKKYQGKDKPATYQKTIQLGSPGLINQFALQHIESAEVIWIVEGITDVLTMQTALGDRTDQIALTAGGANIRPAPEWLPLFAGKICNVVFDNDKPDNRGRRAGEVGSKVWAAELASMAQLVRRIELPVEGTDLRDFFLAGNTLDDLVKLAGDTAPVKAKTKLDAMAEMIDAGTVTNYVQVDEKQTQALELVQVVDLVDKAIPGWPKRVGRTLYMYNRSQELSVCEDSSSLFAFFHQEAESVRWDRAARDCITSRELFRYYQKNGQRYDSIERFPHFPPIDGCLYHHRKVSPGDGARLIEFLEFFNPSRNEDLDLLLSCVLTLFWGAPGGQRPVFIFSSETGRGVGKTTTTQALAALVGGYFGITRDESVDRMKSRLLTPEAADKRVCMLDNLKTTRFSWGDFEALITSETISGHRLYAGEASRPNYLTWFLTMNSSNLSRDVSQRSVEIVLSAPAQYTKWKSRVMKFLQEYHWHIISDVMAWFEREPQEIAGKATRWAEWESDVLSLVKYPTSAAGIIASRQIRSDEDAAEIEQLEDQISENLAEVGYYPDEENVFIPSKIMTKWLAEYRGERMSQRACTLHIKQAIKEGFSKRLIEVTSRRPGRGFFWSPNGAQEITSLEARTDLDDRLNNNWEKKSNF